MWLEVAEATELCRHCLANPTSAQNAKSPARPLKGGRAGRRRIVGSEHQMRQRRFK